MEPSAAQSSQLTEERESWTYVVLFPAQSHQRLTKQAFYFFFFAFNKGPKVVGTEFGNHVGDWEYINIRFKNSVPTVVFFSQHSRGQSFTYAALEKRGKRPIGYIARGTHAVFATRG